MELISLKLDRELLDRIDERAAAYKVGRSALIRGAIEHALSGELFVPSDSDPVLSVRQQMVRLLRSVCKHERRVTFGYSVRCVDCGERIR